jgi:hypothetical protein
VPDLRSRRASWIAACALAGLYLALALGATQGLGFLTPDAAQYAETARSLVEGHGYTINLVDIHPGFYESVRHTPEMHGLLRPLELAGLFLILGVDEAWLRIPGFVYVALSSLAAFGLGLRLFGPAAGLLACLVVLTNPGMNLWALAGNDDTGLAFFFTASVLCMLRGLEEERDAWFLAAGSLAALGLLEKVTALVLPAALAAVFLVGPRARRRWRHLLLVGAPALAAFGVYVLRNYAVHGGPAFRIGPFDWLVKADGFHGFFAYYEVAPELADVLADLGTTQVLGLIAYQFADLARSLFLLPGLYYLYPIWAGLLALLALPRRSPFVALAVWASLGSVLFVCVLHHVEKRYFAMLIPVLAAPLAGWIVAASAGRLGRGSARPWLRVAGGLGLLWVFASSLETVFGFDVLPERRVDMRGLAAQAGRCTSALAFVLQHVPEEDVVITNDPWRTAWRGRRAAVMAPTNGPEAVERVARHYGARWMLVAPVLGRRDPVPLPDVALSRLEGSPVFQGNCQLLKLGSPVDPPR